MTCDLHGNPFPFSIIIVRQRDLHASEADNEDTPTYHPQRWRFVGRVHVPPQHGSAVADVPFRAHRAPGCECVH